MNHRKSIRISAIVAARVAMMGAFALTTVPVKGQSEELPQQAKEAKKTPVNSKSGAEGVQVDQRLTDGLLDLLNEPADKPGLPESQVQPAPIDGEDIGQQNPLMIVQESMDVAAEYLVNGETGTETQQLQNDILMQLDDLIADLQESQPRQNQSEQTRQQQNRDNSEQSTQQSAVQQQPRPTESESSQAGETPEQGEGESGESPEGQDPGQQGVGQATGVQRNAPELLQQEVWGQLPERVRKQLQSRMVEEFLPSYRQQIEAYFQQLLREDAR